MDTDPRLRGREDGEAHDTMPAPQVMQNHERLLRRKRVLSRLLGWAFMRRLRFTADIPDDLPEQFILLSNHESDFDPILTYISFPDRFIYFLMSEHLLRGGLLGRAARFADDPIPIMRQVNDPAAMRTALSIAKAGGSLGLYPAGEREWDGHALPLADGVGKLVKLTRLPLVTFRVEGLYFVQPRWGAHMRHLPTRGGVVGVYGAEEIAALSAPQVTELVRRDLSVDSTAWRAALDQPTRGRALAENLESVLYLCPSCGAFGTLHSHGDQLSCPCGLSVRYTDRDVFAPGAPFPTVHEWNLWQRERLGQMVGAAHDVAFSDDGVQLLSVVPAKSESPIAFGTFSLSSQGISCGGWSCRLHDVRGFGLVGPGRIIFTVGDHHLEARHRGPWNILRYGELYRLLKDAEG